MRSPLRSAERVVNIILCAAVQLSLEGFFFHEYLGVPAEKISVVAKTYQTILTAGYRPTMPRYCTIVRMAPRTRLQSICGTRARLKEVLDEIVRYRPRAIVAAVSLQEGIECKETDQLIRAAQDACVVIPVIFGHEFEYSQGVIVGPAGASIVPGQKSHCGMGHTNAERDFRILPVITNGVGQQYPSLSFKAAQMIDPTVLWDRVQASGPLYTSLFTDKDFQRYIISESELLDHVPPRPMADFFRGRVAVIGFEDERPVETNVGPVSGHILHAAYIEAFLDGRVLLSVPGWIYWAIALIFWSTVELIQERRGPWVALRAIAVGFISLLSLSLLMVHFAGYYSDFPTISFANLFVWLSKLI
jgi:hypothetical protein